jgi:membrane protein YdbS with pleckstrin-like domain
MSDKTPVLQTHHSAARGTLVPFILPFILLPLALAGLIAWDGSMNAEGLERTVAWWIYLTTVVVFLLPPLLMRVRARLTTRYTITQDSVMATRGFLSRRSAEVRIADIRAINVDQTFLDRLTGIGDVSFSSSASTDAEVIFRDVPGPFIIRTFVKDLQNRLGVGPPEKPEGGVLKTAEQKEASRPEANPSADQAALEQLLAESQADSYVHR